MMMVVVIIILQYSKACNNVLLEDSKMYCENSTITEDDETSPCCEKIYTSTGFGVFRGSEVNSTSKTNIGIKVFR